MSGTTPARVAARPRTPALVMGAIVVAISVLVGAVALTSRQSAPPTIAEFAPQAVEQIKESLEEQSVTQPGQAGGSEGDVAPPDVAEDQTTSTLPPVIEEGRVRQCVGSPPRQTEDPQSPPCVPFFDPDLDNGGATHKGVTADQITVAVPQQFLEDLNNVLKAGQFFNKRYEFYGRQLVLQPFATSGCVNNQPDPAKMRADAVAVDEEIQVFATLGYAGCQGADHHYYDALSERQVVSVSDGNLTNGLERNYARRSPYQWNVMAGVDTILANTAQFVCATLAGKPPRYAGGLQAEPPTREFGVISTRSTDGTTPDLTPLREGLSSCGVTPTEVRDDQTTDAARSGVNSIVTLRDAGVTSVMCLCTANDLRNVYMPAASAQGYQPEWVQSSYINNDLDNSYGGGNASPDQSGRVLGISFRNKLLPRQDMPWYWAVKEADPSFEPSGMAYYAAHSRYVQLLLLASGIQMAGPKLTPESFRAGLRRTVWANPGAGGPPYFQAEVGFGGPRHVMSVDASMFWFDPQRPGTVDPTVPGAICYVDRGVRYRLGRWPRTDPAFFTEPCL